MARRSVSVDYFDVLSVPLLQGEPLRRDAGSAREQGLTGHLVVNESLARAFFGGGFESVAEDPALSTPVGALGGIRSS